MQKISVIQWTHQRWT